MRSCHVSIHCSLMLLGIVEPVGKKLKKCDVHIHFPVLSAYYNNYMKASFEDGFQSLNWKAPRECRA